MTSRIASRNRLPRRDDSRRAWPVAFAVFLLCSGLNAPATGGQAWKDEALASFDAVWQTVNDTHYDRTFGGLDWSAVRRELRPRAETADTADAVRSVIRTMLARLGQSHFVLIGSTVDGAPWPGDATLPIEVRTTPAGVLITHVEAGSAIHRAGVRSGDRLVRVDGEDVDAWVRSAGGADERARRLAGWQRVFRALHGAPGSIAHLVVRDPDGRQRAVEAVRVLPTDERVTLGNLPPIPVRIDSRQRLTPGRRSVGVIAFNAWMTAVAGPFAAAVDTYRQADGIIVDLRGNPGGIAEMMRGIAGHFLATPELLGRMHMREVELEFRANPRRSTVDGRRVEPFAGPLAIVVDELSGSASECFTGGMQSLGRARVFGVQTMGQALPASTRRLPNGDVLMYAVGDFVTSTGQRLEGEGVVPDERVPLSSEGLASGRDLPIEAALAWIDAEALRPSVRPATQ